MTLNNLTWILFFAAHVNHCTVVCYLFLWWLVRYWINSLSIVWGSFSLASRVPFFLFYFMFCALVYYATCSCTESLLVKS